ncbi:50S ribosomal protein L15 [Crocinitomix catalasitica]|nr:50S ribosomal protein L15 [Crocinitomix catalasitica]
MKLNTIKSAAGSTKNRKRIARGQGSGSAGTAGRGHKGAKSRSGYKRKIGFEGGQQPLQRRVPKFGFTNVNRIEYKGINLDSLQKLADDKKTKEINREVLLENGLVSKNDRIKILGRGELKAKLSVLVDGFSATAKAAIEAAGGTAVLTDDAQALLKRKEEKKANSKRGKKKKKKPQPVAKVKASADEDGEEGTKTEESNESKSEETKTDETTEEVSKNVASEDLSAESASGGEEQE